MRRGVALAAGDRAAPRGQRARERGGALALAVAKARVAARQREAVGLADGLADLDPHGDVEVADEPPDHGDLLGVLLTEERDVGLGHVEELGHDGRDAGEVLLAARLALQRGADAGDADARGEARRIDLGGRGREQQVGAGLGREPGVARLVARVGAEVLGVVELRRVDEQRHDDDVGRRARLGR